MVDWLIDRFDLIISIGWIKVDIFNSTSINNTMMQDDIHTLREWYKISEVQFGFLFPQEVRRISVCEIDNPRVYNDDRQPIKKGLYDLALGVSPNDRDLVCETCGHKGLECSGHPGHIELILPTYNPLIIDILLKILKISCFNCHRFRIRERIKEDFVIIFYLLKRDRTQEAHQFYQINSEEERRKLQKMDNESEAEKNKEEFKIKYQRCKNRIEFAEKIRRQCQTASNSKNIPTTTSIQGFNQFLKFFLGLAQNKCPYVNCKKLCKRIKKQGANKIFVISSEKQAKSEGQQQNTRKKSKDSISKAESTMHGSQTDAGNSAHKKNRQKYMNPKQIYNILRKIWQNEKELVTIMFGNEKNFNSFSMFFLNTVFVPPSRFRPESKMGDDKYLHDHTTILGKILQTNIDLKKMIYTAHLEELAIREGSKEGEKYKESKKEEYKGMSISEIKKQQWYSVTTKKLKTKHEFINKWLDLQNSVNCFIDSTKSSKLTDKDFKGVRQILQKKEGLFRMKMMGKRVNYAARSVISPDPSLNTDEVGMPIFMSKKLTFPEHINQYNLQKLQSYIINGKKYPGANYIEENGKMTRLEYLTQEQRVSHARNLWNNHQNKIVYRHLKTGDNVLFNRQPTLHKAGLMAHRIKVLPKESTLRMNYANCKSYNADFDGDEMNLHALQTYMAKAQAELCISDKMYQNPTNGKPLRQIMQDAIISAVYLSMRDTFFDRKDYSELIYQATFSILENKPKNTRLFLLHPTILKPKVYWTGKQLISNIIKIIVEFSDLKYKQSKGLCMKSKTKIQPRYMKGYEEQSEVIFLNNELIKGIIDKNQVGSNSDFGFLHSFTELYGETVTGKLMTALNKLFLNYMQVHGFTCGLDDLILKKKVNQVRKEMLEEAHIHTVKQVCIAYGASAPEAIAYMGRSSFTCDQEGHYQPEHRRTHIHKQQSIARVLEYKIVNENHALDQLDAEYKHHLNQQSSTIIDTSLAGFNKKFPFNNFSMMTVTGAKGSNVNHSQVAVMLGQQELEGKRVPMMITGKTLPSFYPYDPNPRASGFISDRFLTGLRQQEFYFHCMAGRQGLIDTAVKTSRSGYLQRCLMKHLQSLKVEYDYTVRDSDGGIIQFLYGEDSLNPAKEKFFSKLNFIKDNLSTYKSKFKYNQLKSIIKTKDILQFKLQQENDPSLKNTTIQERYFPGNNLGSISQKCYEELCKTNGSVEMHEVLGLKYKYNMIEPGQAVGCTAAQSIGEPSTQMTLNTFHLAGHGGVNLTLGIPRLRQLLMTSTDKIKTPIMELHFRDTTISKEQAQIHMKKMEKVKLIQLIKAVDVEEWKELINQHSHHKLLSHFDRKRYYKITLHYEKESHIHQQYQITYQQIQHKIRNVIIPQLLNHITRVKKRNQLRAEIKRTHHTEKEEEDEEEQEKEDEEEKDNAIPQKEKDGLDEKMKDEKNEKNGKNEDEKVVEYNAQQFEKVSFNGETCEIIVKVSLNLKKFLMTKVIEKLISTTIMKEIQGINSVVLLVNKKKVPYIQTEGVNFDVLERFDFINRNTVRSNDIQALAKKLGIQAARNVLVQEIVSLFGAYGVSVDYRHLYLIGDYVTFGGNIKAMNRNWMNYNPSPFLRMTFQTSVKFITESALRCEVDYCRTPSSKIILGQCPELGTGLHQLLMETNL